MTESKQPSHSRVKLSGLWLNQTRAGKTYWSGANGTTRYSIWENEFAKGPKDPTHSLYVETVPVKPVRLEGT